jgi:hypothetical protein
MMVTRSRMRSKQQGLEWIKATEYWIDLVNIKALLGQNGYREALVNPQRCGSKVDTNQGVHMGGSQRYASAI